MADVYSTVALKAMKKLGVIGIVFCVTQALLFGKPYFKWSQKSPFLTGNETMINCHGNTIICKKIAILKTSCDLYFPFDGSQPDTSDAGKWSGARYAGADNDAVTDFWIRIFGGDRAVELANGRKALLEDKASPKGVNIEGKPTHIIRTDVSIHETPLNFEQDFWKTFREIAQDPVGRVLLYRLLIEIRRVDEENYDGCFEDNSINSKERNTLRSIVIRYDDDFGFCPSMHCINFNLKKLCPSTLQVCLRNDRNIVTAAEECPCHISLFHEMLHWFHYLRNYARVIDNKAIGGFKYAMRSYYGDLLELGLWGANCNGEEIVTILGSPNYNKPEHREKIIKDAYLSVQNKPWHAICIDTKEGIFKTKYIPSSERFLNGDDLSENSYRLSKSQPPSDEIYHMRFGHVKLMENFQIERANLPPRYLLAHKVAVDCYEEITGHPTTKWGLTAGEAIK